MDYKKHCSKIEQGSWLSSYLLVGIVSSTSGIIMAIIYFFLPVLVISWGAWGVVFMSIAILLLVIGLLLVVVSYRMSSKCVELAK